MELDERADRQRFLIRDRDRDNKFTACAVPQGCGETSWTSALLPVSVDGVIVASSMTLLADSGNDRRSGLLPWILLVIGSAASLVTNVAVAEPSAVGQADRGLAGR